MKASSTATGSGSHVSGGVWLPKGSTLKAIMLICSSVVNKKNLAPVSLLFRHTLYLSNIMYNDCADTINKDLTTTLLLYSHSLSGRHEFLSLLYILFWSSFAS